MIRLGSIAQASEGPAKGEGEEERATFTRPCRRSTMENHCFKFSLAGHRQPATRRTTFDEMEKLWRVVLLSAGDLPMTHQATLETVTSKAVRQRGLVLWKGPLLILLLTSLDLTTPLQCALCRFSSLPSSFSP